MNAYRRTALTLACLSLIPAAIPTVHAASNWQMTSGLPTQREVHRGTHEVRNCVTPGDSISVGMVTPAGPSINMLAERLDVSSGQMFRFEYDTTRLPERAAQAAEFRDSSGFAEVCRIDPTSATAPASRFTITKISCSGIPLWRFICQAAVEGDFELQAITELAHAQIARIGTKAGDFGFRQCGCGGQREQQRKQRDWVTENRSETIDVCGGGHR